MSFVGIDASKKCFENIRKIILEKINEQTISFIHINLRSIENVKNIKFETIIIEDNINKFKDNIEILEKLCSNTKYLIINTDKNPQYMQTMWKNEVITYGLNQKATVTVSSISDTNILIYLQKSLQNKDKKKIEIEERRIKKKEKSTLKTYEILIIYIILMLYGEENYNFFEEI